MRISLLTRSLLCFHAALTNALPLSEGTDDNAEALQQRSPTAVAPSYHKNLPIDRRVDAEKRDDAVHAIVKDSRDLAHAAGPRLIKRTDSPTAKVDDIDIATLLSLEAAAEIHRHNGSRWHDHRNGSHCHDHRNGTHWHDHHNETHKHDHHNGTHWAVPPEDVCHRINETDDVIEYVPGARGDKEMSPIANPTEAQLAEISALAVASTEVAEEVESLILAGLNEADTIGNDTALLNGTAPLWSLNSSSISNSTDEGDGDDGGELGPIVLLPDPDGVLIPSLGDVLPDGSENSTESSSSGTASAGVSAPPTPSPMPQFPAGS
ncbi:hypothetical protein MMC09_003647 [Bachmanniomyces sp. S44760]|nr:hypothetical protein [Bachmanniomyces sp. S44760]